MQFYNKKIIKAGDVIEVYTYEKEQARGYTPMEKKKYKNRVSTDREEKEKREDNLNRTKKNLRRIINANSKELNKFLTLTFKDNIKGLDTANYKFKKFVERLKYTLKKEKALRL